MEALGDMVVSIETLSGFDSQINVGGLGGIQKRKTISAGKIIMREEIFLSKNILRVNYA